MDTLRHYRVNLQKFYGKNDYWMVPIFRSLFSMTLIFLLSRYLQMTGKLGNPLLILSLGLLSFFLPFSFVPCLIGIYLLYYFYTQSILYWESVYCFLYLSSLFRAVSEESMPF